MCCIVPAAELQVMYHMAYAILFCTVLTYKKYIIQILQQYYEVMIESV